MEDVSTCEAAEFDYGVAFHHAQDGANPVSIFVGLDPLDMGLLLSGSMCYRFILRCGCQSCTCLTT